MKNKQYTVAAFFIAITMTGCSSNEDLYSETPVEQNNPLSMETIFNDSTLVYTEEELASEKDSILTEGSNHYSADAFLLELSENGVDLSAIEADTMNFKFDSTELSKESKKLIKKHVDLLQEAAELKVILEGHTDSSGDRSYNLKLGERRALAVKEYAVTLGALPHQIEVISFGEEKLLNNENSDQEKQENRRAVFVYK